MSICSAFLLVELSTLFLSPYPRHGSRHSFLLCLLPSFLLNVFRHHPAFSPVKYPLFTSLFLWMLPIFPFCFITRLLYARIPVSSSFLPIFLHPLSKGFACHSLEAIYVEVTNEFHLKTLSWFDLENNHAFLGFLLPLATTSQSLLLPTLLTLEYPRGYIIGPFLFCICAHSRNDTLSYF